MTIYTWDDAKRLSNLRKHGLDFADAPVVLSGDVHTMEDCRFHYGERRFNALGYLQGQESRSHTRSVTMEYELSHLGKLREKNATSSSEQGERWDSVMPIPEDNIEIDEDCPEYDPRYFSEPIHTMNGRIIPPRQSPLDPFDPEVLAFMKSITPLVQMEPEILGGMPVFKNTLVPIKGMFDYLLTGKSMDDFLIAHPSVPRDAAIGVLQTEATLFYEEISKALDKAAPLI